MRPGLKVFECQHVWLSEELARPGLDALELLGLGIPCCPRSVPAGEHLRLAGAVAA